MSCHRAELRLVLISLSLVSAGFAAQIVEGHVVNAVTGADIRAAVVNLIRAGTVAYSATTDSRGHFQITAVKPGAYTASYMANGSLCKMPSCTGISRQTMTNEKVEYSAKAFAPSGSEMVSHPVSTLRISN